MMADSWKTDGNCNECRRQKYCKKQCTKAYQRGQMELRIATAKAMVEIYGKHDLMYPIVRR